MTLGITGAGGQLGAALLRHTLNRTAASHVVAITRHPEKISLVTARAGDFNQPGSLLEAFRGIERLVMIPTADLSPGVRARQHRDAIAAAKQAGVQHVIYISSVSPRLDPNNELLDSHFATEQALIASGLNWTLLRMSIYADTLVDAARQAVASGVYSAVPGEPAAYVAREDIAAAAAGILTSPGHHGITYHATGPASLSQREVAEAISEATGKPVKLAEITPEQWRQGMLSAGLPAFVVDAIAGFHGALRAGAFDLVTGDVRRLAGKPAQPVVEFLRGALR
jgi:NAD(P)H dehydrogenase (quinone)